MSWRLRKSIRLRLQTDLLALENLDVDEDVRENIKENIKTSAKVCTN